MQNKSGLFCISATPLVHYFQLNFAKKKDRACYYLQFTAPKNDCSIHSVPVSTRSVIDCTAAMYVDGKI